MKPILPKNRSSLEVLRIIEFQSFCILRVRFSQSIYCTIFTLSMRVFYPLRLVIFLRLTFSKFWRFSQKNYSKCIVLPFANLHDRVVCKDELFRCSRSIFIPANAGTSDLHHLTSGAGRRHTVLRLLHKLSGTRVSSFRRFFPHTGAGAGGGGARQRQSLFLSFIIHNDSLH